jgi:3-oxoacyl-[acyl-carrier protein] reductase
VTQTSPTKVAVVTGAGSGVGAATARLFASRGYAVALLDRDLTAASAVAESTGGEAIALLCDVTDQHAVTAAIDAVGHRWSRIDVLVNNAGAPHPAIGFERLGVDVWRIAFDVNVLGIVHTTAAALPLLRASSPAAIVNVASVAGVRARAGLAAYCAAKAAAISLTQTLAIELAPEHIRVNAIGPGALETPMFQQFLRPGESHQDGAERYAPNIPLGRLGHPDEIADAILWAAEPTASFVTGQVILVDGGRSI